MKTFVSGLALATLVSGTALAATSTTPAPGAQTSASVESVAAPKLIDKITLSTAGTLTGPSVAGLTGNSINGNTPTQTVKPDGTVAGRINFDAVLRAGYKITPSSVLSANMTYKITPVLGEGMILKKPYLQLATSGLIKSGNYSLTTAYRVYAPTTQSAIDASEITALRAVQSQSYSVGRWSLGLDTFAQGFIYGQNIQERKKGTLVENNSAMQAYLFASPNLSYQITPTVSAGVYYEAAAAHMANAGFSTDYTALYPNVSWDVTPAVNVNPFLMLHSSQVDSESMTVGANLSAKFL